MKMLFVLISLFFRPAIAPVPQEVHLSDDIRIEVHRGLFRTERVPALLALTADGMGNTAALPDSIFAQFGGIKRVPKVVPMAAASVGSRSKVRFKVYFGDGKPVKAVLRPGEKKIVFAPGDYVRCAVLRVYDTRAAHSVEDYRNVMVFGPGWHSAENDSRIAVDGLGNPVVRVGDSTAVVLEAGAHVAASFDMQGSSHVKICGPGWINLLDGCQGAGDGFRGELWGAFREGALPAVYVHKGAKDIVVDGPGIIAGFRAVSGRCSEDITVRDVVMLTSAANADGLNFINCCGVTVKGCLVHSEDDCLALFNNCDSIRHLWDYDFQWPAVTKNLVMRDCVLWTTCRPFCIGGHGTGSRAPRDSVKDITVERCKVYQAYELSGDRSEIAMKKLARWGGAFRVLSQSGQSVSNISFNDIDYYWAPRYLGQLFHLCVREDGATSYGEGAGYEIRDVRFSNIRIYNEEAYHLPPFDQGAEDVLYDNVHSMSK